MSKTLAYTHLLNEAEEQVEHELQLKIKESLIKKVRKLKSLQEELSDLEYEIKQLTEQGRITNLNSYIKINEGLDKGKSSNISLSKNHKEETTIGMSIEK